MIFDISATGNSKYVAQRIGEATGDSLIALPEAVKSRTYRYDVSGEKRIGFVVPVYYYGLPSILNFFMEKLQLDTYVQTAVSALGGRNLKAITALLDMEQLQTSPDTKAAVEQAVAQLCRLRGEAGSC